MQEKYSFVILLHHNMSKHPIQFEYFSTCCLFSCGFIYTMHNVCVMYDRVVSTSSCTYPSICIYNIHNTILLIFYEKIADTEPIHDHICQYIMKSFTQKKRRQKQK